MNYGATTEMHFHAGGSRAGQLHITVSQISSMVFQILYFIWFIMILKIGWSSLIRFLMFFMIFFLRIKICFFMSRFIKLHCLPKNLKKSKSLMSTFKWRMFVRGVSTATHQLGYLWIVVPQEAHQVGFLNTGSPTKHLISFLMTNNLY